MQKTAYGVFDDHSDVGPVKTKGEVNYDANRQEYTLTGSGTNMWLGSDEFHVVWKRVKGNFILSSRAQFVGKELSLTERLAGLSARVLSQTPRTRPLSSMVMVERRCSFVAQVERSQRKRSSRSRDADILQLERKGDTYVASMAKFGDPFVSEQIAGLDLGDEVYVGLLCMFPQQGRG